MDLVEQAPRLRAERSVDGARRAAGVGRGGEAFAALALVVAADGEVTRDEVYLLPMVVDERRRREGAGLEPKEPGAGEKVIVPWLSGLE